MTPRERQLKKENDAFKQKIEALEKQVFESTAKIDFLQNDNRQLIDSVRYHQTQNSILRQNLSDYTSNGTIESTKNCISLITNQVENEVAAIAINQIKKEMIYASQNEIKNLYSQKEIISDEINSIHELTNILNS